MATSSNGDGTLASNGGTAAQRTQEKHASHQVTPSDASKDDLVRVSSAGEDLKEGQSPLSKDVKTNQHLPLDTTSKDAFPALGAGPKPQTGTTLPKAWDSTRQNSVENGHRNGLNGQSTTSGSSSSRTSSPTLSTTPVATNGNGASRLAMPGQHVRTLTVHSRQLQLKKLKKPLAAVILDFNQRSRAKVSSRHGRDENYIFEASGHDDAVAKAALEDFAKQIGVIPSGKGPGPSPKSNPSSSRAHVADKLARYLQQVQKLTGAKVYIPKAEESASPGSEPGSVMYNLPIEGNAIGAASPGKVNVRIRGNLKQAEEAKQQLEKRARIFDNSITRSIRVDKNHHGALIGASGANIRDMVKTAGGSEDDQNDTFCKVRVPAQGSNESTIHVEGNKAVVEKVVTAIENFVRRRNAQQTKIIEVAPEKHNLLIGRGGATRKRLEAEFDVKIDIPKRPQEGPARPEIKITGQPEDIEKARVKIMEMVDQESKMVTVARSIHHALSDRYNIFVRLRQDYRVTVSHEGVAPPPKPTKGKYSANGGQRKFPLIAGAQHDAAHYTWEVSDPSSAKQEEGTIPWVLRGSAADVSKALPVLEKAIQEALTRQRSCTGYLVLPDTASYRFIVGIGGAQIRAIREETGCEITIPRDQAGGAPIEIVGSREQVEDAKDIILHIVQTNGPKGQRGRGY